MAMALWQLAWQWIREHKLALIVLIGTWLVFFSQLFFLGKVYFLDDLKILYLPIEHAFAEAQAQGVLPLWDNRFGFGHPLLAWGQLGFFIPLHMLLRAVGIPALALLQVSIVSYWAFGLLGMFGFFRVHRLSMPAATLGAIVFAFSGYQVGHLNHVNFYVATMILPWLLLAIHFWLQKVTLLRTAIISVLTAVMILSGHPQATLYALLIAVLYGVFFLGWRRPRVLRRIGVLVGAAIVCLLLSSLFLLPLFEFIPETERAHGSGTAVLYEFSYAPWHAITLIAPYFFGDHDSYWGAKGFQELAAFVGLLPLLLAAGALSVWKKTTRLKAFAVLLILLAILLALGKYSFFYRLLVETGIIASLNIPGRFVLWFTTGVSVLAALGLDEVSGIRTAPQRQRLRFIGFAIVIPAILLTPFFWYLQFGQRAWFQLLTLLHWSPELLLGALALITFVVLLWLGVRKWAHGAAWTATLVVALTLIVFGWSYNPMVARTAASQASPLAEGLQAHSIQSGIPARLYSRPNIFTHVDETRWLPTSEPISDSFTVLHPLTITHDNPCFEIPLFANSATAGTITISLQESINGPVLDTVPVTALDITNNSDGHYCFTADIDPGKEYVLAFHSKEATGVNPYYRGLPDERSAYFVRVASPTQQQVAASQKHALVRVTELTPTPTDHESRLLVRHQQVQANASAARWIGALAIDPYRRYINGFLDDNIDSLVDGDGRHLLQRNRAFFDAAGVTHLAQSFDPGAHDLVPEHGFIPRVEHRDSDLTVRLYENPSAFPKAYLVPQARFLASDSEVRQALANPEHDFLQTVYIQGDVVPQSSEFPVIHGTANVVRYEHTRVDVQVTTEHDAWLVVTDSTVPQWHTTINGTPAPYYVANTVFKAAFVPAGDHVVSFQYHSNAVERGKWLTALGGLLLLGAVAPPWRSKSLA